MKKERVSFSIEKSLLDKFDEYCKSKDYQRRNKAIVDLIEKELKN